MKMVLEELTQDELAMLERYRKERDSDNEYTPWISEGITEADYFRRLYLEKCNELAALSWARWVPVSERLPEKSGNYIILVDGITAYGKYDARYCEWYIIRRTLPLYITHWMPLPPAPDKK